MLPIAAGMRGEASLTVDQSQTATALGGGNVPTFGTRALIALMERAAVNAFRSGLEDGEETVGSVVNVRDLASTPLGKHLRAEAIVTAVDGRTLSLSVRASDAIANGGEGLHERVVIVREQFIWKAAGRGVSRPARPLPFIIKYWMVWNEHLS